MTTYRTFFSITPGLEQALHKELTSPPISLPRNAFPSEIELWTGGIESKSLSNEQIWTVANYSRLAESIRIRLGRSKKITTFYDMELAFTRLPWKAFLPSNSDPHSLPIIKATTKGSKLYHIRAIEERLELYFRKYVFPKTSTPVMNESKEIDPIRVFARIADDQFQFSITASTKLSRRSEGKHVLEGSLKETLAAALLTCAGFRPDEESPIWDPFCGSGTILSEAMSMSLQNPIERSFPLSFELWRNHPKEEYQKFKASLPVRPLSSIGNRQFIGSDIKPDAIEAAQHNLMKWKDHSSLICGDFEDVASQIPQGTTIVSNLPFGHKVIFPPRHFERFGKLLERRKDLNAVVLAKSKFPSFAGGNWHPITNISILGIPATIFRLVR